jgi:hypothetical protein
MAGRMLADMLQDIDQIVVEVDLSKLAGHDQAQHDLDVFGAELSPAG